MTAVTPPAQLEHPITGGARRSVNFFNGRLLTGEDLSREQEAARRAEVRLGRIAGTGVALGLEVTKAPSSKTDAPVVTVQAGLAVAPDGRILELPCRADVGLIAPPNQGTGDHLLFSDCAPRTSTSYVAGSGVFVLLLGASSANEGRAPVSGIGGEAACAVAYRVDAVQLRLVRLPLGAAELTGNTERLRASVTDRLFGVDDPGRPSLAEEPYGPTSRTWGSLDALRPAGIGDDEVPIAVLHWTAQAGMRWIAPWAARRNLARDDQPPGWPSLLGQRVRSDADAYLLAFQDHLDHLRAVADPAAIAATEVFTCLPPAGLLPIVGPGRPNAFLTARFFAGLTVRGPMHLEGRRAAAILHQSLQHDPIDISTGSSSPSPIGPEAIWLYIVRETVDATHGASSSGQPSLLFASGHLPYAADAQFDLARWDFANFALRFA